MRSVVDRNVVMQCIPLVVLNKRAGSQSENVQSLCFVLGLTGLNLLTYLLIPWSRALLEKLTGSAASQEIPRVFGTRRFITVLTSARNLSLS